MAARDRHQEGRQGYALTPRVFRPVLYTPELADDLCGRLADGVSLRSVCRSTDMPSQATVYRWLKLHPQFRTIYTIAQQERACVVGEKILALVDGKDSRADRSEAAGAR